jgi:DNA polymerase
MPKQVKDVEGCEGCPMRRLFPTNTFVEPSWGTGKTLVCAEAPGEEESIQGKPLVGGSGKWFNSMAKAAGHPRETLTCLNIIQCRPLDNLFPTDAAARSYISKEDADRAVKHCIKAHVLPVLEHHTWTKIIILGDKALRWLTGRTEGVTKWRGSPLTVDTEEVRARVE